MSTTTALQLIQQATGELGLNVPTTAFTNTNADVVQIYRLLNAVGYELAREHDWQALQTAYFFTTPFTTTTGTTAASSPIITAIPSTAGLSTNYTVVGSGIPTNAQVITVAANQVTINQNCTSANTAESITFSQTKFTMPSDYDRQINETHWDKAKHWKMIGPETPQQWEWLVSGYIATGPRVRYRIMGDTFQIWPPQGNVATLGFEYVSKSWAASSAPAAQSSFLADTDTCIFADRLMVLGLKHRYTEAKGLPLIYQEAYEAQKNIAKANDAGAQTLSMAPTYADVLITWQNIPDANFTL